MSFPFPDECRQVAEALFPAGDLEAAADFAEALGIGAEYRKMLGTDRTSEETERFLSSFRNNLDLLIRKTWVEKTDELRKETLRHRVPPFMTLVADGEIGQALPEFGAILKELAFLLFGEQGQREDFLEYAFRVDTEMGLFWWYASRLQAVELDADGEFPWALLFIGLCYLTNF